MGHRDLIVVSSLVQVGPVWLVDFNILLKIKALSFETNFYSFILPSLSILWLDFGRLEVWYSGESILEG